MNRSIGYFFFGHKLILPRFVLTVPIASSGAAYWLPSEPSTADSNKERALYQYRLLKNSGSYKRQVLL